MKTIFLTAGHHLKDSGAVGNGYKENALTIELRDLITLRAKQLAPEIKIWNDNDSDTLSQVISKIKKVATANDILIELHLDSANSATATGSTALIAIGAREKSLAIAKELVKRTAQVLVIKNRGVKTEADSARGRLGILHTAASSVLLEVAFISNPNDMAQQRKQLHWLAEDIALYLVEL